MTDSGVLAAKYYELLDTHSEISIYMAMMAKDHAPMYNNTFTCLQQLHSDEFKDLRCGIMEYINLIGFNCHVMTPDFKLEMNGRIQRLVTLSTLMESINFASFKHAPPPYEAIPRPLVNLTKMIEDFDSVEEEARLKVLLDETESQLRRLYTRQ